MIPKKVIHFKLFFFFYLFFQAGYGRSIFLFVSTSGSQNQINNSDLDAYKSFQNSLVRFLNKRIDFSPKIIEARLSDIKNLPQFIHASIDIQDKIDFIVFQGHGNYKEIAFDLSNRFSGNELANILSDSRVMDKLTDKEFSVYFPACQCGLTPNDETLSFQEEFANAFSKLAYEKGKIFKIFQTIAHPNLFNNYAIIPGFGSISWLIQKSGFYSYYQKLLLSGQRVPGKWGEALAALTTGQIRSQLAVLASIGLSFLIQPETVEMKFISYSPVLSVFALTYLELFQVGVVKNLIYKNNTLESIDLPLRSVLRSLAKKKSYSRCNDYYN